MIANLKQKLSIDELPSLPASAMQVMQMVLDPEVSLDKLSIFIKRDVGLSTKIMRLINTPRYSASNGTMDIQKAVVTLGLNTIKNLALSLSLLEVLSNSIEEKVYKHIFDLSLCNATTTEQLSGLLEHDNIDQYFFCGLVQYFGLFVLAETMQDSYWELYQESQAKGLRFTKVLEERTHICHRNIGYELAKKWGVPEVVCNSIKFQEDPHASSIINPTDNDIRIFETVHLSMLATEIFISPGKSLNIEKFKQSYEAFYDGNAKQAEKRLMRLGKRINHSLNEMSIEIPRKNSYTAVLKEANKELSQINLKYEELYHELNLSNDKLESANIQLKEKNKKLQKIAAFDFLTNVHNRSKFEQELERFLSLAKRRCHSLAIILIDFDDFKLFNDLHGEVLGNEFLKSAAAQIQSSMRKDEFLARVGGDAFAIIQPNIKNDQDPSYLADRILNVFDKPFKVDERLVNGVTVSIGIACYPQSGDSVASMIKSADIALSRSKRKGKNSFNYFTEELSFKSSRRLAIESAFNKALDSNEFRMVYQPIMDINNDKIFGFEALMRWCNEGLGHISPIEFIPHAEESGRINMLGKWCINDCLKQISSWQQQGIHDYVFAINISPKQLLESDFLKFVLESILKYDIKTSCIEVELTENEVMENIQVSGNILNELVEIGVKTNIDDFGTGHSSLLRLKQIAFNALKIDRSFVNDMLHNQNSAIIVEAIISMSKSLGLKTIAEGIEEKPQLDFLKKLGCDYAQGYYFSKPTEAKDIPALIKML